MNSENTKSDNNPQQVNTLPPPPTPPPMRIIIEGVEVIDSQKEKKQNKFINKLIKAWRNVHSSSH